VPLYSFPLPPDAAIAVLSDTHGLLRPEVTALLRGAPLILHAGDVGDGAVLSALRALAPTVAVRGNVDRGPYAASLPLTETVDVNGRLIHIRHILQDLDIDPAAAGFDVVITGHSHAPAVSRKAGVLYLNPGSVGPRRFTLPVAMAFLRLTPEGFTPEPLELPV
jgi:putative phosphoesterase